MSARLLRRLLPAAAAACLSAACRPAAGPPQTARFRIEGSITAPTQLQGRIERPDAVLIITAMNAGGVPVAVKRILQPKLPIDYQLTEDDLLLPGTVRGPLTLKVHVSSHGQAGIFAHGDLVGTYPGAVSPGDRHVNVSVDREV